MENNQSENNNDRVDLSDIVQDQEGDRIGKLLILGSSVAKGWYSHENKVPEEDPPRDEQKPRSFYNNTASC